MTWEAVFDRLGGLWTAAAAIVGFGVANYFELRREARQAERDQDREWRIGQQSTIAQLQEALQKLADATGDAALILQEVSSGAYPLGKDGIIGETWYQKWESAVQSVAVLGTRLESVALKEKVDQVMWEGGNIIAVASKPIDFENLQGDKNQLVASIHRLQALTRETQGVAGQVYQELNRPSVSSDNRPWLCRRLC